MKNIKTICRAAMLLSAVILFVPSGQTQPVGNRRAYATGNFALNLDGEKPVALKSMSGGGVYADVISQPGGRGVMKKRLSAPRFEDFTVETGLPLSSPIQDWINNSWSGKYQRKDGQIVAADSNFDAREVREFKNALLTEVTIPACDGSSKDPDYLTLKFSPESIRSGKPAGKVQVDERRGEQKAILPSNFRLTIDGLDCSRVTKIDALTVKQSVATDDIGNARDYQKQPGRLEFPNLKITLAESGAKSWQDWAEDFIIKGNNGDGKEHDGRLQFLDADLKRVLLEIKFTNLGIFKLTSAPASDESDKIQRVQAELYCEKMEFVKQENDERLVPPPTRPQPRPR